MVKRDRELEAGASAHFEDPAYYTSTYATRTHDVSYYVELGQEAGAVLEHGVGNGRIALPLARLGVEVWGIDQSKPMLDDLRAQLRQEPADVRSRLHVRRGDIRKTKVGRRFPLVVCPFNTALHLYTRVDVERWLANVREHLEPGGKLVFDVSMPILEDLARDPNVAYRTPPFRHPTLGRVNYAEYFDYDRVRQILFVAMCFEPAPPGEKKKRARGDDTIMTPLAHRQFFPRELEALLHYGGFEVVDLFGNFEGGPLTPKSDVMVWHVREARRAAARKKR